MRLHPTLLIVASALLPAIWGWAMYWLVIKFWRSADTNMPHADSGDPGYTPHDYQI